MPSAAHRRSIALPLVLAATLPSVALAAPSGGASAPGESGGASYGQTAPPEEPTPRREAERGGAEGAKPRRGSRPEARRTRRRRASLVVTRFDLYRPRLFLLGHSARVSFRVDGRARRAWVRLALRLPGTRRPVNRIDLGELATRRDHSVRLTGREGETLRQGRYELRIAARDGRGRRALRRRGVPSTHDLEFLHHRFPLAGDFSYGGSGSRFGAPRRGRTHQGQDLAAAEGTPIVAPRGGIVEAVQYQAGGAGHYVVLDAEGEDRDYVFMHMRDGSARVREGQRVRTGQRIGDVGSTGGSTGPHLHFEIWVDGGWYTGGRPIDPLPYLRAWDSWS